MTRKRGMRLAVRGLMAAGLAGLLVWPGGAWAAGSKAGAKVRVELKSAGAAAGADAAAGGAAAGEVAGELVGVRKDAIVLGTEAGESREIAVADIAKIRVVRRSGAVLGAVAGGLAIGAAGVAFAIGKAQPGEPFLDNLSEAVITGGAGALLGGALGVLIGGQFGGDKTYDLTNMSGAEVERLMLALRKKARVQDYQ